MLFGGTTKDLEILVDWKRTGTSYYSTFADSIIRCFNILVDCFRIAAFRCDLDQLPKCVWKQLEE